MLNSIKYKIKAIILAITLFFVGVVYADQPIEVEFDCNIPSSEYLYSPGEDVRLNITVTNTGRPFELTKFFEDTEYVGIYQEIDGERHYIYTTNKYSLTAGKSQLVKKGDSKMYDIHFRIPDDAPTGAYDIFVSFEGNSQVFENYITVE